MNISLHIDRSRPRYSKCRHSKQATEFLSNWSTYTHSWPRGKARTFNFYYTHFISTFDYNRASFDYTKLGIYKS